LYGKFDIFNHGRGVSIAADATIATHAAAAPALTALSAVAAVAAEPQPAASAAGAASASLPDDRVSAWNVWLCEFELANRRLRN